MDEHTTDFFGVEENAKKDKAKLYGWLSVFLGICVAIAAGFIYVQTTVVRGTISALEKKESELRDTKELLATQRQLSSTLEVAITNELARSSKLQDKVLEVGRQLTKAEEDVRHWKRENEKALGSVVVVERREKALTAKFAKLNSEYEEVKKDNDELNRYLKSMKEATKAKLIELDKKYIELQFESRKWKRNYETLRNCLLRKVAEKQSEEEK